MPDENPGEHTSAQDLIKSLEKALYDADIPRMVEYIGELHVQWASLSPETQSNVMKLEAIFLSILNARVKRE
jgi:hypothetical protein